jgi:hypothetical protein
MSSKRYIPEQIIGMLRETEVALAHQTTARKGFFKRVLLVEHLFCPGLVFRKGLNQLAMVRIILMSKLLVG